MRPPEPVKEDSNWKVLRAREEGMERPVKSNELRRIVPSLWWIEKSKTGPERMEAFRMNQEEEGISMEDRI